MASNTPVLKKLSPLLPVADLERAIDFYTQKLGFSLDFRYDDFYAGIVRDGHSIHLRLSDPPVNEGKEKDELDINCSVENIEELYQAFQRQSVDIIQPLREQPYGWEFYIADPDGNHLGFVEEAL